MKTNVLYLQKDKFQFYSGDLGKVFEFRFVQEIVRDLDVLNSELLENLIKVFITNNKFAPSSVVFVLADNAYFVKDFVMPSGQKTTGTSVQPEITKELLQKKADEFIEHVPFDNVVSKSVPVKDGIKVCATNKDFYEAIAISFEHLGFTVECVIPGLFLGGGLSARPVLDPPMANAILQKLNSVRQYNLLGQQVYQPLVKQETEEVDEVELERLQTKKPDKKRLYTLVGVFASLLIVLVIVYVQSTAPPTPPKEPAMANTSNPTPTEKPIVLVTPTPAISSAVPSGTLQQSAITVQIISSSTSASNGQLLLSRMNTYQFKSVTLQPQTSIASGATLIAFSSNTPQSIRNIILAEVKKIENNVIVQEKQIGTYDVTIVLGQ